MLHIPPYPAIIDPAIKWSPTSLTDEHIKAITDYGDVCLELLGYEGKVGFNEHSRHEPELRRSRITWLHPYDQKCGWIYEMLIEAVQNANAQFWRYDLWGYHDSIQYTTYLAEDEGYFDWHMDLGDAYGKPQRKLSASILLSDPETYDGGDFQYFEGGVQTVPVRDKGTIIVFPSWLQHRVTPVTRGVRKSLVAWACGPMLR